MRRAATGVLGLILVLLVGCSERKSSTGWAAQVPADVTRYRPGLACQEAAPSAASNTAAAAEEAVTAEQREEPPPPRSLVQEPTEVTLWHAYRKSEKQALVQVVEAFHALGTPVTVKLRVVPFDAFNDKLKVVIPEGDGPDLFIFAHDTIGAWAEMEFLEPLNGWTEASDTEAFLPETVRALVYRDALYGMPLAFKCLALFYNKALITEPPTTLEEMVRLAKVHTDGDEKYGLVYEATNLYFHAPWVHGFGGRILDEQERVHVSSPEAVQALEFARRLVQEHGVVPDGVNTSLVSGFFNDGLAAMAINGPWMRGEIEGVDYGVAPLPAIETGKPARPFLGVEAVYMNRRSTRKQAAFEVMRFLVSDASARVRFEVGRQPVANRRVWEGDVGESDTAMAVFRTQMASSVTMSSSPRMQQVWAPYNQALLSVLAGSSVPAEALQRAKEKIEADMLRARGTP